MSTKESERSVLLQGTLDLIVLRTLQGGALHGHGITIAIQQSSHDVILVDHGSLYPALQRLEDRELIRGEWGVSANGRRARFYTLSAKGQKQLIAEADKWRRLTEAVTRILGPSFATGLP